MTMQRMRRATNERTRATLDSTRSRIIAQTSVAIKQKDQEIRAFGVLMITAAGAKP